MKFDTDIPIPPKHVKTRYGFEYMSVGDSFFIPHRSWRNFTAASHYASRHPGWKFITREWTQNKVKGVRVWCVERPASILHLPKRVHTQ